MPGSAHGYDVVFCTNVLHDTRDVEFALRQVHALLKPGGLLLLNEYASVKDCLLFSGALLRVFLRTPPLAAGGALPALTGPVGCAASSPRSSSYPDISAACPDDTFTFVAGINSVKNRASAACTFAKHPDGAWISYAEGSKMT